MGVGEIRYISSLSWSSHTLAISTASHIGGVIRERERERERERKRERLCVCVCVREREVTNIVPLLVQPYIGNQYLVHLILTPEMGRDVLS